MEMKKLLESLQECGINEMPPEGGMTQQDGTPVSMNVSLNASGKGNVEDLISMMKNAGMGDAQQVSTDMMPMRHDMESFRSMVDGPEDATDKLMHKGEIGEEGINEGQSELASELHALADEAIRMSKDGRNAFDELNDSLNEFFDDVSDEGSPEEKKAFKILRQASEAAEDDDLMGCAKLAQQAQDALASAMEGYENEPDEDRRGTNYMTKDLAGGLNREKDAYADAEDGDNPMAVETIKQQLLKLLSEKKTKPDFADIDGDGDKKEPMKKAAKDKKKGKK